MLRFKSHNPEIAWRAAYPFDDGWRGIFKPNVCHFGTAQKSTTQTTQNVSQPWGPQQPYLTQGFAAAGNLLDQAPPQQQYPVAPFNDAQSSALGGIEQTAANGTPISSAATNFATMLENGAFLGSNPANGYFGSLAGNNIGLNGPGASILRSVGSYNPGLYNPGAASLYNLANSNGAVGAPGSDALSFFANNNIGANNSGTALEEAIARGANPGTSQPGASTLADLSGRNVGVSNMGTPTLAKYASGGYFSNGYTDPTAQSVMASVVPQIEAQFNRGNSLNNPAAAFATAQGATAALAPLEYQNYQQQEQLQQNAASTLASNALTGNQQRGTFAQALADLGLQGTQLQGQLAQNVAGNTLAGGQLSTNAAGQSLDEFLKGLGLTTSAASDLSSGAVSGAGVQEGAGSGLETGAVGGGNLQATGASGLSNNWQDTLAKMVQGNALAPQNQALSYADLDKLFSAGSAAQTQAQNEAQGAAQTYNYSQLSPYQQLAQYMQAVTGNYGGTTNGSTTTPYFQNRTADTLGTVSSLASIASAIIPFL